MAMSDLHSLPGLDRACRHKVIRLRFQDPRSRTAEGEHGLGSVRVKILRKGGV